jgi:hypothetical protein
MNINITEVDRLYEEYEGMNAEERYNFLICLLEEELTPDYVEKLGLIDIILDMCADLKLEKQYEKIMKIQALIGKHSESILDNSKFYIDSFAVEIDLFKRSCEAVEKDIESFIKDPVDSIDIMMPIYDKLKYYGYNQYITYLSKQVYNTIRNSDKLIGGTETYFSIVILMMEFQELYTSMLSGVVIKKDLFLSNLKKYDYIEDEIAHDYNYVLEYANFPNISFADYKDNLKETYKKIFFGFCRYVYDNKKINYPTAHDIWEGAWQCFELNDSINKISGTVDKFFVLKKKEFYDYIKDDFGFLSNKSSNAIALLWGIPYVYDFLKINNLLKDDIYTEALKFVKHVKLEVLEGLKDSIWEYDFVHTWVKPDSISDQDYIKENEYFEKTFHEKVDVRSYLPTEYFYMKNLIHKEIENNTTIRNEVKEPGRNDPCPCGSGKKYKKCCG